MALVRVYCGISSIAAAADETAGQLTIAIVDDSGRLLEYCEISDDAAGYAHVTALLAERFSGSTQVMMACDSDDHVVISLLAAAGRLLAYADDETADDYADRFADDDALDEVQATGTQRRAVGLARALQAGALSATVTAAPREFAAMKPILTAHAALAVGRHAAAVALREVLRELYPAALRAYPDPAEPVALAVLDLLPEPSMLSPNGRGLTAETVAARLVADGVCHQSAALEAVTALRVAIAETPRRSGLGKQLTSAVAETVRRSVAALRSLDQAIGSLLTSVSERFTPAAPPVQRRSAITITSAPPATTPRRRAAAPTPVHTTVAPRPVAPPPMVPQPVAAGPIRPTWTAAPQPPGFEPTPVTGMPTLNQPAPAPVSAPPTPMPMAAPAPMHAAMPVATPMHAAMPVATPMPVAMPAPIAAPMMAPRPVSAPVVAPTPIPSQRTAPIPVRQSPAEVGAPFVPSVTNAAINYERAARRVTPSSPAADIDPLTAPTPAPVAPVAPPAAPAATAVPGDRANWPLVGEPEDTGRVTPPWQASDLVLPPEPLGLQLSDLQSPVLRLIDGGSEASRIDEIPPLRAKSLPPRRTERSAPAPSDDDDLLIFASVSSAWFAGEEGESTWNSSADLGWRAAEKAAQPSAGSDTNAGLPRRVPQANLVPGSPLPVVDRPLQIVRNAGELATHTSNYFRGWRRGNQEVGGYAVGGRPGRESATGWDFSRDHEDRDYRAANHR